MVARNDGIQEPCKETKLAGTLSMVAAMPPNVFFGLFEVKKSAEHKSKRVQRDLATAAVNFKSFGGRYFGCTYAANAVNICGFFIPWESVGALFQFPTRVMAI